MAKMNLQNPDTILMILLAVVLGIQFFTSIVDIVTNSLDGLAAKDIPLASLFGSDGVVMLLIVGAFVILVVKSVKHGK